MASRTAIQASELPAAAAQATHVQIEVQEACAQVQRLLSEHYEGQLQVEREKRTQVEIDLSQKREILHSQRTRCLQDVAEQNLERQRLQSVLAELHSCIDLERSAWLSALTKEREDASATMERLRQQLCRKEIDSAQNDLWQSRVVQKAQRDGMSIEWRQHLETLCGFEEALVAEKETWLHDLSELRSGAAADQQRMQGKLHHYQRTRRRMVDEVSLMLADRHVLKKCASATGSSAFVRSAKSAHPSLDASDQPPLMLTLEWGCAACTEGNTSAYELNSASPISDAVVVSSHENVHLSCPDSGRSCLHDAHEHTPQRCLTDTAIRRLPTPCRRTSAHNKENNNPAVLSSNSDSHVLCDAEDSKHAAGLEIERACLKIGSQASLSVSSHRSR